MISERRVRYFGCPWWFQPFRWTLPVRWLRAYTEWCYREKSKRLRSTLGGMHYLP